MRKISIIAVSLFVLLCFLLSGCGSSSSGDETYEFLAYSAPPGYEKDGSSSEPLYDDGSGHSIGIFISYPDVDGITSEDMLQGSLESYSSVDVERLDDYVVDGMSCPNVYAHDNDINTSSGHVYFVHGDALVDLFLLSYNEEIPDDAATAFYEFCSSVHITE